MAPLRLAVVFCAALGAHGHGILTAPAPRDGTDIAGGNKGNNAGPCGTNTATAGTPTATLAAGAETTVRWALNLAHNGPCEVKIAATDGALAGAAVLENVAACNQQASVAVTVPANTPAGSAVLQWNWSGDAPYFDCADITITAASAGAQAGAARTGGAASGVGDEDCDADDENCGGSGKMQAHHAVPITTSF